MTPILETQRLRLRAPKLSDVSDLVEGMNDYNTVKYLEGPPYPYTQKDAEEYITMCSEREAKDPQTKYFFFLELKDSGKVIGDIDLSIKDELGSTGSWVHRDYRCQGFMTEAKIAINNYYFNNLDGRKMVTEVYDGNEASYKTQIKMGYQVEGFRRQHSRGGPEKTLHYVHQFGMLKDGWLAKEKELVQALNKRLQ